MVTKLVKHGARARGICCLNYTFPDSKKQSWGGGRQEITRKGGIVKYLLLLGRWEPSSRAWASSGQRLRELAVGSFDPHTSWLPGDFDKTCLSPLPCIPGMVCSILSSLSCSSGPRPWVSVGEKWVIYWAWITWSRTFWPEFWPSALSTLSSSFPEQNRLWGQDLETPRRLFGCGMWPAKKLWLVQGHGHLFHALYCWYMVPSRLLYFFKWFSTIFYQSITL